ncbi:MAG: T9SS type A sorting domain-containing protein [Bacteroidetes bacterium]|nr:T9SS type A sorting domain-containing protein [Bacteroidota bacterium]
MKKLILLELAFLFLATTFSSNPPPPGWYQQTLPVNDFVNDIFFLDSLNGWAVTLNNGYILNTTNGGNNWDIQMDSAGSLYTVQFLDIQTGYVLGNSLHGIIYKTINGGLNWNLIHDFHPAGIFRDMSFVNKDTGWVCSIDVFDGGLFKTTDGGISWQRQLDASYKPGVVFFLNKDTGWVSSQVSTDKLLRTTNGGLNWNMQYDFNNINDIFFVDRLNGFIGFAAIYKTTDGGFTWTPGNTSGRKLSFINDSIGWAGSGSIRTINKTTNGGLFWYSQPSPLFSNISVFATDSLKAWAGGTGIVHTNTGGDTLTGINQTGISDPLSFILNQNYPNPFNPKTVISYELLIRGYVKLSVYDIAGRNIKWLIDEKQNAGEHRVEFNSDGLSSGIYFYRIEITD